MKADDFDVAVQRTGLRPGSRGFRAARAVLVDGASVNGAARLIGIDPSVVSRAVNRVNTATCPTCGRPWPKAS